MTSSQTSAPTPGQPPRAQVLYVDYAKCMGCETCEAVCRFLHKRPRIVMLRMRDGVMAPLYCHHCDRPTCLKACPHGALDLDERGVALLNPLRCVSCQDRFCLTACPHGAILCKGERASVVKCDLCAKRQAEGLGPACVEMCPSGAILLLDRETRQERAAAESDPAFARVARHIRPRLSTQGAMSCATTSQTTPSPRTP